MADSGMTMEFLIGWQDLDSAGRPHWPNYFLWVSRAFDQYLVKKGVNWRNWIEEREIGMPIQHARCDYKGPLSLHERVSIELHYQHVSPKGFETVFSIRRVSDHEEVASGLIRRRFVSLKQFRGIDAPDDVWRVFLPGGKPASNQGRRD